MAEYAVDNRILEEPAFTLWTKYVLNKRDQIISKTQRYCVKTHNYGIKVIRTVKEAAGIDKENGNTLWWDVIIKEM